jgi:hypothetical protein
VTTPAEVLMVLNRAGVTLSRVGDKLKYKAPGGVLTPELKAEMLIHKSALLEMIGPCPGCGRPLDRGRCWWCHYRLCEECRTQTTGSAFRALCMQCGLRDKGST